jgi:hypothetical protein
MHGHCWCCAAGPIDDNKKHISYESQVCILICFLVCFQLRITDNTSHIAYLFGGVRTEYTFQELCFTNYCTFIINECRNVRSSCCLLVSRVTHFKMNRFFTSSVYVVPLDWSIILFFDLIPIGPAGLELWQRKNYFFKFFFKISKNHI